MNTDLDELEAAVRRDPNNARDWQALGSSYLLFGRPGEAAACYQRAIVLCPAEAKLYEGLGVALLHLGRNEQAGSAFSRAVGLAPDCGPLAYAGLALLAYNGGDHRLAARHYRRASELEPGSLNGNFNLAKACIYDGHLAEGEALLRDLIRKDPSYAAAYRVLGQTLQLAGEFEQAEDVLLKSVELEPARGAPYLEITRGRRFKESDRPFMGQMASLITSGVFRESEQIALHFALAKAHEDLGEYKLAIFHLDQGNCIAKRVRLGGRDLDRETYRTTYEQAATVFRRDFLESHRTLGSTSQVPIFIVGMIRSGTTLVEQIVSSHPEVAGEGELPFWLQRAPGLLKGTRVDEELLQSTAQEYEMLLSAIAEGKPRVTDKMPGNYGHLGLIHLAFPHAKIIHCRRDPVDTCLSIYKTPNAQSVPFAYDRGNIVFAYKEYRRLMKLYRSVLPKTSLLDVQYEDLIADQKGISRRILEFLGLTWDERCLKPELNDRIVATPSVWQVRQPVYSTSVGQWRRFEPWLGAFAELLPTSS